MAGIIADISSDIQKLQKIKAEIAGVKKELKGINIKVDIDIAKGLQSQLTSLIAQYDTLVDKIAQSEAKVMLSVKRINGASEKIIKAQEAISKPVASTGQATQQQSIQTNTEEITSLHGQAKAYNDLKAEINSILGTREENIKRMVDEQNAIKLINTEIKRITKSQDEYGKLSIAQQERLEQLNNSLLTHKTTLAEVQQNLTNNVRLDNATVTSMNELSQSLSRMRMAYRELTEEGRNSSFGKELLSSINQADTKIKELDATIGVHARNVGDYAKQWNGLQYQMQMVAREMPNFAINPQTGIISLTNNLPYLVDELKKAKDAHKAYIAEVKAGNKDLKEVPSVGKQVLSSLLNWQTAIIMGITLITAYRKEISDWIGELFKAKDATDSLVDVQSKINDIHIQGTKNAQSELTKLDALYKASQSEIYSKQERLNIIKKLQGEYPDYFGNLSEEAILAGKAESAYNKLAESIIKAAVAKAYSESITQNVNETIDLENELDRLLAKQDELKKEQNDSFNNLGKGAAKATNASREIYELGKKIADNEEEILKKQTELRNKQIEKFKLQGKLNSIDFIFNANSSNPIEGTKQYWEEQKNIAIFSISQIKDEYLEVLKSGVKEKIDFIPDNIVQQYNDAIQLKQKAEKALKVYDFSSKPENQAETLRQQQEKYNLLLDKQSRDRIRKEEDLQMQTEQARINAMKEGNARTLEQMNLDHKKEMQQLKRQREDDLRALIEGKRAEFEANPENKGKVFNASGVKLPESQSSEYDQQEKFLLQKQANDRQAYMEAQKRSWNEYLSEYANFQERKQALLRLYDDKIAKATTAGEKASLKEEFRNKLKDMNLEEIKSSINFADIFSNLDSQSTEAIRILRDKLKEIIEKSAEDLKPTDLKTLQDALQNMNLKIAERDPFRELKNGLDNYKAACKEAEEAQKNYNATLEKGWTIVAKYDQSTGKTTYEFLDQKKALEGLTDAERKKKESQIQLTQSVNNIGEQGQQVVQAGNDLVDMLTSLGVSVPESVAGALDGLGQVMSSLASIDLMKPMSILTGITGTLAGLGKAIGSIFGLGKNDDYAQYIKMQEHLKRISDVWDDLIDKKKEYMGISVGSEAAAAEEEAIRIIEEKQQRNREAANKRLEAKEKGKKHTYGKRMWSGYADFGFNGQTWEGVSKEIKEKKGIDIGYKLSNMANLTAEQLDWIKENYKDLWANLDEDYRTYLENIINGEKEKNEVIKAGNEAILSVSFESFSDGILNSLYDIKTNANDIADDISDYMRKALIRAMYVNNYQSEMEAWYKKWKVYMSDDKLDDTERIDLDEERKGLIDRMTRDVQGINEMFDATSAYQQQATKGTFQTMSQDKGEELSGRFTAFQNSNEEIKNQSIEQTSLLSSINEKMSLLTLTNEDLQRMSVDTPDIAGQARESMGSTYQPPVIINFPTDQIISLASDVSSLKGVVDEIRTNQVDRFTDIVDEVSKMSKNTPVMNRKLDDINDNIKKAL